MPKTRLLQVPTPDQPKNDAIREIYGDPDDYENVSDDELDSALKGVISVSNFDVKRVPKREQEVRTIVDLPANKIVLNESPSMWDYDTTLGKTVRRRRRLFNVGTVIGTLKIVGIVRSTPSFGEEDPSIVDATLYKETEYVLDCKCGRKNILKPYHYLYYRGQRANCGSKECIAFKANYKHTSGYEGQTIGRLKVIRWVVGKGWECECGLCNQLEFVRFSHQLKAAGNPKKCAQTAIVKKKRVTKAVRARMDGRTLRWLK